MSRDSASGATSPYVTDDASDPGGLSKFVNRVGGTQLEERQVADLVDAALDKLLGLYYPAAVLTSPWCPRRPPPRLRPAASSSSRP